MRKVRKKIQGDGEQPDPPLREPVRQGKRPMDQKKLGSQRRGDGRDRTEYYRAYYRAKKNDPEWRAKQRARRQRWAKANPDKARAQAHRKYHKHKSKWNARKAQWQRDNREHVTQYRRKYYEQNGERVRAITYAGRDRRDPSRVIRRIVRALRDGSIGLHEAVATIREQVDAVDRRVRELGGLGQVGGRDQAGGGAQDRSGDQRSQRAGSDGADPGEHGEGRDGLQASPREVVENQREPGFDSD